MKSNKARARLPVNNVTESVSKWDEKINSENLDQDLVKSEITRPSDKCDEEMVAPKRLNTISDLNGYCLRYFIYF